MNLELKSIINKYISKKEWTILIITFFTSVLLYYIVFYKNDLTLLPIKHPLSVTFYNDSIDGGKSKIISYSSSDSSISMQLILNEGFVRPYIGTTIENKTEPFFDFSDYNKLEINLEGGNLKNIIVYVASKVSDDEIKKDEIFFSNIIELSRHKNEYILDLDNFKIPDWWYDNNNLTPNRNISPEWSRCRKISIATGLLPTLGTKQNIQINSITFKKNNTLVISIIIILNIFVVGLLKLTKLIKPKGTNANDITIHYKPITIPTPHNDSLNHYDYINQNFQESNLSLDIVSKNTGINQRQISDDIFEKYGCNFKTYINRIRINEAQRLIKETNLNISQIAYNVGFSSPNNFNRVFKKLTGKTPTEFSQNAEI